MSNIVTMSYLEETLTPFRTDAYELKPNGRLAFFQKWMWKLLHKMDVLKPYWDTSVEIKRVLIDTKKFADDLIDAYGKCFPHSRPKHVYMGPAEFERLAMDEWNGGMFTFDIKLGYNGVLFNLPVTVVPHMNGVLII
jgi:hypothetical protein